jgi:hypothetical protein
MSDLIERLRKNGTDQYDPCGLCDEAADEIERLRSALERIDDWFRAYPVDIFTPLQGDPLKKTGDYDTKEKRTLITRASAAMARHMIDGISGIAREALEMDNGNDKKGL